MKIIVWNSKMLKIFREINDKKYGIIWDGYLNHKKVYILNGQTVVEDQAVIDELDNKYGWPVCERGIDY
ncbi:MAG: hypothetical protein IJW21_06870 [Clostridia bacterium]|nr:hypothetical protein [Clostridia bacterium]